MSYTEIYAIGLNGDIEEYGEVHNAWGGAMHIWLKLREKYSLYGSNFIDFNTLWKSTYILNEADSWVMFGTFDRCIILKKELPNYIKHLHSFVKEYPTPNLEEQLSILERASKDDTIRGICFNQTSVNSNPWWVDTRPYNIDKDTEHWFLTAEILFHS